MSEFSDQELLERFRDPSGSQKHYAFNLLVKKYQQRIYAHIRRMVIDHDDANDLVQNTFIKIWSHLDGFREDSKLFTWMYRVATNETLGFLKQKKKRFFLPIGNAEAVLQAKLIQEPGINANRLELKLQKAILALPEKQRLVFHMRYYDNMKYEEMSQVLETSVGALKASYHHAVQKVEKYLKED